MASKFFTARDLRNATGIGSNLFNMWKTRGFITSDLPLDEAGNQAYTFNDILRVGVIVELIKLGVPIGYAVQSSSGLHGFKNAEAVLAVRSFPSLEVDKCSLGLQEGRTIKKIIRASELESFRKQFPGVIFISIDWVEDQVKKALYPSTSDDNKEILVPEDSREFTGVPEGFSLVKAMEKRIREEGGTPLPRIAGVEQD